MDADVDRSPDADTHDASGIVAPVWRERTLIGLEAFLGLWAVAGAVGLASGAFDLGDAIDDVPRQSPVLAAVALLVVVAIPALVIVVLAMPGVLPATRRWR